jgi:hypothetical protein
MNKVKLTLRIVASPIVLIGILCVTTVGGGIMAFNWVVKGGKVLPE